MNKILPEEPPTDWNKLIRDLKANFQFNEISIDKDDFSKFKELCDYPKQYQKMFGYNYIEKLIEHYISLNLLNLNATDVFMDVAADRSYFADYIITRYNIESYRQDLNYRGGIFVSPGSSVPLIGGDASCLPFRDDYLTALTLHCSLEHFENTSDSDFMAEA